MTQESALLITPRWTRDGGVGAHVQVSAAALAAQGLDVTVLAAQVDAEADTRGVTVVQAPRLFDARAPIAERVGTDRAAAAGVVHLHQVDDPELVRELRRSAPVLVSAHGYTACTSGVYYFQPGHECTRAHGPGCVPNLLARGCAHTRYPKTLPRKYLNTTRARAAIEQADMAISYSTAVDRHLAANGITRRAIVPYFPTMSPRPASGHDSRRRVVFAGRVVRPKGVGVLIRAASQVDAEFRVCGDGRELDAMRALAARLDLQERVHFTGWLDAEALAQELAEASIVVMPSLWPEPFGLVGIEALATGRPAVASATGGIPDWLEDGVNGLAVTPGDAPALASAINELLEDPARQRSMGAAGREMVAELFSRERHAATLRAAYATAAEHWRARTPGAARSPRAAPVSSR